MHRPLPRGAGHGGICWDHSTWRCDGRYIARVVNGGVVHRAAPCAEPVLADVLDARRLSVGLQVPAFALITTGVTIGGHVVAHGSPPSSLVTLGIIAVSAAGRLAIGHRAPSFLPMAALMTIGQVIGHSVLAASESMTPVTHAVTTGHQHAPVVGAAAVPQTSPIMTVAHLGVAVALAWWLFRGEALSDALGRRLAQRLVIPTTPRLDTGSTWSAHGFGVHTVVPARFILAPAPGRAPPTH